VNTLFEHSFGLLHQGADKDDRSGGPVADFIVLCPCDLDHHLCAGVLHGNLGKNGRAIVCDNDIARAADKHLVHAPWAKSGLDGTGNCLCRRNIRALGFLPVITLYIFF
jgi:hypothetical protein